jgi:hypothetical protein
VTNFWAATSALTSVGALIVVVAATAYAYRQIGEAARARTAATLLQFQQWNASDEVRSVRRRLPAGDFDAAGTLSPADADLLEDVVDRMEFLGMLVERDLLDIAVVRTFYRYSPRLVWQHAQPFILLKRQSAPGYGEYLERLAAATPG